MEVGCTSRLIEVSCAIAKPIPTSLLTGNTFGPVDGRPKSDCPQSVRQPISF